MRSNSAATTESTGPHLLSPPLTIGYTPAQRAGRPKPRAEAEGRCPGKKGTPSLRPEGPRDLAPLVLLARTEVLIDIVGHLKRSHDGLPSRGPSNAGPTVSRPFRPHRVVNLLTQGIGLRPR